MKMFYLLITVMTMLCNQFVIAQTRVWEWARSPDGESICRSVINNSEDDLFITGVFYNDLVFDSINILSSAELGDIFVANFDLKGNVNWVKRAFGNYGDEGQCIATSYSGNAYVAGEFFSNYITFDSLTLINNHITPYFNDATKDIFLVKYDRDGNIIWAKSGGGTYMEFVRGIAVDKNENITIVGTFWSSSVTFGNYSLINTGNIDVFIVQFDSNGKVIWAKNPVGIDEDNAYSVAADTLGNVYIAGSFRSTSISFDNITLNCSSEKFDTYIVKFDALGNAIWAENASGNSWDEARCVALDKLGNIYLTGYFDSDSITFDSITLQKSMPNNNDMFLVKYDSNNKVMWARRSGGNIFSWVYPDDIAINQFDNIWITGVFIGDGIEFQSISLSSYGSYDPFLVEYDGNGNALWAESIGGSKMDWGEGIAVDNSGNGYLGGYFESDSIVFGDITLFNNTSRNKLFLAKKEIQTTSIVPPNFNNPTKVITASECILFSNFPNPFNATTKINFRIIEHSFVSLKVYDLLGKEIVSLINGEKSSGNYTVEYYPKDLPSGIYLYQLQTENYIETKKMMLLK